jgi:hypothetical protein
MDKNPSLGRKVTTNCGKGWNRKKGTARRQELLKALWKLSERRDEVDSSVPEKNAMAVSTSHCQSKAKALASESLSVSC